MKRFVTALVLAGVAAAAPAWAENVCIDSRDIVSSKSTDGKTLVFKMRDGRTFVNHLQGVCSDLKFNGYSWVLRSGDTKVCEREQSLRVIQSGQVCVLGKFDPPTAPGMNKGTN
jgi:ABC-type transport system substrate-binding protein